MIYIDTSNRTIVLFEYVSLRWCKRSGYSFVLSKECGVEFSRIPIHMTGWYIQILNYGGHIMWKSDECLEDR